MIKTTITQEDQVCVMTIEGRLDTSASAQTEQDMQPLFDYQGEHIVIDCSKLDYISSSGLRLFLRLQKITTPRGSKVTLKGLSDDIRQVFVMTGFSRLFEIV